MLVGKSEAKCNKSKDLPKDAPLASLPACLLVWLFVYRLFAYPSAYLSVCLPAGLSGVMTPRKLHLMQERKKTQHGIHRHDCRICVCLTVTTEKRPHLFFSKNITSFLIVSKTIADIGKRLSHHLIDLVELYRFVSMAPKIKKIFPSQKRERTYELKLYIFNRQ